MLWIFISIYMPKSHHSAKLHYLSCPGTIGKRYRKIIKCFMWSTQKVLHQMQVHGHGHCTLMKDMVISYIVWTKPRCYRVLQLLKIKTVSGVLNLICVPRISFIYYGRVASKLLNGSFSDNFNFSMKKASRAYNFCFISKRHVVFNWQNVGHIKTWLNAQKYKKDWNKFIFWLFKCLKFLPSRFTVFVTHSITCIILPLSNIIICFKLSYTWKQTTE